MAANTGRRASIRKELREMWLHGGFDTASCAGHGKPFCRACLSHAAALRGELTRLDHDVKAAAEKALHSQVLATAANLAVGKALNVISSGVQPGQKTITVARLEDLLVSAHNALTDEGWQLRQALNRTQGTGT